MRRRQLQWTSLRCVAVSFPPNISPLLHRNEPIGVAQSIAAEASWKRPLARGTRADGPHSNTHLSAPPDLRKVNSDSTIAAQFSSSMRRTSMRRQDDKLQVELAHEVTSNVDLLLMSCIRRLANHIRASECEV